MMSRKVKAMVRWTKRRGSVLQVAVLYTLNQPAIEPELKPNAFAYLYDIIITSTYEEYLKWLLYTQKD